jgi:hypothetical protein
MADDIKILRHDEANEIIAAESDPITKHLITNAMYHFLKRYYQEKQYPVCDFDMYYFVALLHEIFSEHDVLRRILAGEKVGSFGDDRI